MNNVLKQSTAVVVSLGPFLDKTDGVTLETGLVSALDHASTGIMLSKNGGTLAVRHATVTATTYDAHGCYQVTLDTTDTGTLGSLRVIYTDAATCLPVWRDFEVVPAHVYDGLVAGSDNLQVDTVQVGGTAQSAGDIVAIVRDIAVTGSALNAVASSYTSTYGTQTGTYANTQLANGTTHDVAAVNSGANPWNIDGYYEFQIGAGVPVEVQVLGFLLEGGAPYGGDSVDTYVWNWGGAAWEHISPPGVGDFVGSNSTTAVAKIMTLLARHVGTGADAGKVRIRLAGSSLESGTILKVDQILVRYAIAPAAVSDIAAAILETPENPLVTDASGNVTVAGLSEGAKAEVNAEVDTALADASLATSAGVLKVFDLLKTNADVLTANRWLLDTLTVAVYDTTGTPMTSLGEGTLTLYGADLDTAPTISGPIGVLDLSTMVWTLDVDAMANLHDQYLDVLSLGISWTDLNPSSPAYLHIDCQSSKIPAVALRVYLPAMAPGSNYSSLRIHRDGSLLRVGENRAAAVTQVSPVAGPEAVANAVLASGDGTKSVMQYLTATYNQTKLGLIDYLSALGVTDVANVQCDGTWGETRVVKVLVFDPDGGPGANGTAELGVIDPRLNTFTRTTDPAWTMVESPRAVLYLCPGSSGGAQPNGRVQFDLIGAWRPGGTTHVDVTIPDDTAFGLGQDLFVLRDGRSLSPWGGGTLEDVSKAPTVVEIDTQLSGAHGAGSWEGGGGGGEVREDAVYNYDATGSVLESIDFLTTGQRLTFAYTDGRITGSTWGATP